jgi:hypothetical protein
MAVQIVQNPYDELQFKLGQQAGQGMLRQMGIAPEQQFMKELGPLDFSDPNSLYKVGQKFLEMGDYERAQEFIRLAQQGLQEQRLLEQATARVSKVTSPGSPLTRELKSAAELIQLDPDLTSAGFSKLGLDDKELKAASKEVASRAKQIQKQAAAEGTSMAYTEAEQLALDMMKQEGRFSSKEHLFGMFNSMDYNPQPVRMEPGEQREVVERRTKDGKIGLFDANTKEFIGYK